MVSYAACGPCLVSMSCFDYRERILYAESLGRYNGSSGSNIALGRGTVCPDLCCPGLGMLSAFSRAYVSSLLLLFTLHSVARDSLLLAFLEVALHHCVGSSC